MDIRKEEYLKVLDKFPDVISVGRDNYHLHFKIDNAIQHHGIVQVDPES